MKMKLKGNYQAELETPRLVLSPWKIEYAKDMYKNWATDKQVVKFLTWDTHKSLDESVQVVSSWLNVPNYRWCIVLKETGEGIGSIDTVRRNDANFSCEIGYCLSRKYWSQGIMTEALKKVIDFLFDEGYFKITLKHAVENPASGRVMQKAGMTFEGKLPYDCYVKGKFYDCNQYYILNPKYFD